VLEKFAAFSGGQNNGLTLHYYLLLLDKRGKDGFLYWKK